MRARRAAVVLASLAALVSWACDDGAAPAEEPSPCAIEAWRQPTRRFPVGSTVLLPVIDTTSAPGCVGTSWRLDSAPAGSANVIVDGERFTAHVPGEHRFVRDGVDEAFVVTVVDSAAAPFHQLNYYPTRSLAVVGDQIWTANVWAPTVSRLHRATGEPAAAPIAVGAWPVALAVSERADVTEVLVAERGADELGVIDVAGGRRVDGIHVGDEPASVVVSPDGATAWVALAVSGQIVAVDVAARAVVARVTLAPDLLGLALSPDGTKLYAARHRSGHPDRYPYPADPVEEERDVFVLDAATLAPAGELVDVGTTIKALHVSADGARLYVAGLENNTAGSLGRPDESLSFVQSVKVYATASLELIAEADLSRQESSAGDVVSLHGMAELDGKLWVTAEGIDRLVALDPLTLAEVDRAQAPGRPRFLVADAGELLVHGAQGFVVATVDAGGALVRQSATASDPRPAAIARGQRYFTGQGRTFGTTWSCNSCHADGLTDTLIWNAGPLVDRVVPRPFVWLEGAYPLGWAGYMYDVWNYAYEVNGNVGIRPVTGEARDLGAYLASLMPPPAATDATRRDGRLGEAAARGKALFEGEAMCATCHPLPLTTSRERLPDGITEGVTDIPVLAGAYRHGTWLKHGEARTLPAAAAAAVAWLGLPALGEAELAELAAYLGALAGGDLFVLASEPRGGVEAPPIAADRPLRVSFSLPVWNDPANLARVRLVDAAGADVPVDVSLEDPADGHRVWITPRAPLDHDAEYAIVVDAELEAWGEERARPARIELRTARAPALRLEGEYVFHVDMPVLDFAMGGFDPTRTNPVRVSVAATPTAAGAHLVFDLGQGLVFERDAVLDGDTLWLPPAPVPIGPSFGDAIPDGPATLADADADGVADGMTQTFTMAGPGFLVGEIAWRFERPVVGCPEGNAGAVTVSVVKEDDAVLIDWSGADDAVALYVTDAAASIPLGPGPVTGGASYWIVQSASFPMGFAGPVAYGEVPEGAVDAGAASMAVFEKLESGKCYKVSVTTTALTVSSKTFVWP